MALSNELFPRVSQLWRGAILVTVTHAVYIAAHPLLSYEVSWDGPSYSRQDSMGTLGTITFAENGVVGAFRDENSTRSPYRSGAAYDLDAYLEGMPPDLLSLVKMEALQYLLDDYMGATVPVITAAFWSSGDLLTAAEQWREVYAHGAHLVSTEIMETEAALSRLRDEYELSESQIDLITSIFTRKINTPTVPIILADKEVEVLLSAGSEGIDDTRELFEAIGVILPW